jgi:hypothetical protein
MFVVLREVREEEEEEQEENNENYKASELKWFCLITSIFFALNVTRKDPTGCHLWILRGSSKKFMDWRHCAAVMQREVVTYVKL